jgi:adenosylmethionine-8-amino-7-oxononanoate aminotransferase
VDGRRYLDGNSSWWVAALGHGHPRLLRVLSEQAATLAHCALAGIAHEPAARLAEELCAIAPPGLSRVFYTDNGSTAIEVAVKMCVQAWRQLGAPGKTRFVALDGAFHGDTIGAAALGGVEVFRRPFAGVLFECVHAPVPDESGYERAFDAIARIVREGEKTIAAVVVEPIVQGAAGMRIYPAEYLRELRALCDRHDVFLVLDEVFAGYGRTGPMWASAHAGITPDLMCIGKAMASLLPMGATLATERVFDAFRGSSDRALYYGHTFCGHPLGAALAREVLAIYREEDVLGQVARKGAILARGMARLSSLPGVERVRSIGMIGAADLATGSGSSGQQGTSYLGSAGWRVYEEARARGAYLRPLGDTVYLCPPLTIEEAELESLLGILEESVRATR